MRTPHRLPYLPAALVGILVVPVIAIAQAPSTPNPPYLAGFPSVDKVKSEVRGANAVDTVARQVATFDALEKLLQKTKGTRAFLPDESRFFREYYTAQQDVALKGTEKFTPAEMNTYRQSLAKYSDDAAFATGVQSLLSPAARAQIGQGTGTTNAQAPPQAAQSGSPQFVRNDPGTVVARRCLESGGSDLECIAAGLKTGFDDLTGASAFTKQLAVKGLVLGGAFTTATGEGLGFEPQTVAVGGCGKLEAQPRTYKVTRQGDQLQIQIDTLPKPMALVLGPDGRMTGPASIDLDGKVIVGYEKYTVYERRVSDNGIVPGSGREETRPIYQDRRERCSFGALRVTAPVHAQSTVTSAVVALAEGRGAPASQRPDTAEAPAGPRMAGTYAMAGGLKIEFEPTQATLDCGDAHTTQPYSVKNSAERLQITIQNGTTPVALTLRPDGALAGSGTVQVSGRVVTGTNDTGATFTPRTTQCTVGVLTPQ
jgi:hypothetical protein